MNETHEATGESAANASDAGRANVTQDATGTAVWVIPDPKMEVEHEGHDDDNR